MLDFLKRSYGLQYVVIGYDHALEIANRFRREDRVLSAMNEIDRIVYDENPKMVIIPTKVPQGLSKRRPVLVCGAVRNFCVKEQIAALRIDGYNAELYEPAIIG
jgi:hypothetical protein